ncbi:LysR family transcriptional regulator [Streptomyces sp. NPDC021212]|uniref:LysR family transcriptional regulator n=1 Tax=Streptomyces sp. NPDC021212 TaxID=3365118 RepID=UPI0037AED47F
MADTEGTNYPGIRQLRLFLLLAEELHFGHAARRAYLAQPTFSRHIQALERQLGAELVARTTRRTELTDVGRTLLPRIREVVDAAERLHSSARHQAAAGRMVIGSFEAVTSMAPIPAIMDELHRLIPEVDVQVLRTGFDSPAAIFRGDVDASFVFLPVPEGIQTYPLAHGARCAAMSSSDPLASEGPLRLSDLSDHEHIGWSPDIPAVWRDFWSVDPRPEGIAVRYTPDAVTDYESALILIAPWGRASSSRRRAPADSTHAQASPMSMSSTSSRGGRPSPGCPRIATSRPSPRSGKPRAQSCTSSPAYARRTFPGLVGAGAVVSP